MTQVIRMRKSLGRQWSAGFTLVEIVVSLAVVSVAATIGVSMFTRSFELGNDVRDRRAAQDVAQEIMADLQRNPAAYQWPAATDQLQTVTRRDGQSDSAPPTVTATYPAADRRIKEQYEKLQWKAYVRLPEANAKTRELTVVVSWIRSGKTRSYTLTALAPPGAPEVKP